MSKERTRVKFLKSESLNEIEIKLNDFLSLSNSVDVIKIQEMKTSSLWVFMILYKEKEIGE